MKQFNAKTGSYITMVKVSTHEPCFTKMFGKYDLETSTKPNVLVMSQHVIACRVVYVYIAGNRAPWVHVV